MNITEFKMSKFLMVCVCAVEPVPGLSKSALLVLFRLLCLAWLIGTGGADDSNHLQLIPGSGKITFYGIP